METGKQIRILIADDHELMRLGLRTFCKSVPNFTLVGEAVNGKEMIEMAKVLTPDVIITDIIMPVADGLEATKAIKKSNPRIRIIAFSFFDNDYMIVKMLEAGALGYLIKSASRGELFEAVMNVYTGKPYYCDTTNNKLAKMIAKSRFNPYEELSDVQFDAKELEIIRLLCEEKTSQEISDALEQSVRTVEGYRLSIFKKMNVRNVAGMVVYAVKNRLYEV